METSQRKSWKAMDFSSTADRECPRLILFSNSGDFPIFTSSTDVFICWLVFSRLFTLAYVSTGSSAVG